MMAQIALFDRYEATVRLRRDEAFGDVRPEAEVLDGQRLVFFAAWPIEVDQRPAYAGEWAMQTPIGFKLPWIASGDLTDLRLLQPAPDYTAVAMASVVT